MTASIRITVYPTAHLEAITLSTPDRVQTAEEIATEARATAPVVTGEYRDGISVVANGDQVAVVDSDPTAGFKEYGTGDTPAHAVLTDAARRHGRYSGIRPRSR